MREMSKAEQTLHAIKIELEINNFNIWDYSDRQEFYNKIWNMTYAEMTEYMHKLELFVLYVESQLKKYKKEIEE